MRDFFYKNKSNIVFALISLVIFVLFILSFMWPFIPSEKEEKEVKKEIIKEEKHEEEKEILVDIKGQIKKPGVFKMSSNERVNDAITKAGGLTNNADTSLINLSQKVKDEMVIIVYSKEEVQKMNEEEPCICPDVNDACINEENKSEIIVEDKNNQKVEANSKISINTASKEELMMLDGIGETKAVSIIEYRSKNGNFKTIEEIMEVSGIGEAAFEKIKEKITI